MHYSDRAVTLVARTGLVLSFLAMMGQTERFGKIFSVLVWTTLWVFYLSIVNMGQVFYSFGWEMMTLECGFLAIFLGSRGVEAPASVMWFLRWVLFRLMFGAGLIKLRGDACWRDLTCMFYHYETQPLPSPLTWFFHHLPQALLKFQTLATHFVELVVPWFYFVPGPLSWIAGALTIGFQLCLIFSGNLSWLNYLTIIIALSCFDDAFWKKFLDLDPRGTQPPSKLRRFSLGALAVLVICLSIQPAINLFSPRQLMNASFNSLHLVNTYGAFGSVTKSRNEIIFEGTDSSVPDDAAEWKEYGFKGKPGDVHRLPPAVAPYHLRLDWLLWFAAMSDWREEPWIMNLVNKLLRNDPDTLKLIGKNPFPDHAPRYIRARLFAYRFTTPEERKKTGDWWVRKPGRLYLPPISLERVALK